MAVANAVPTAATLALSGQPTSPSFEEHHRIHRREVHFKPGSSEEKKGHCFLIRMHQSSKGNASSTISASVQEVSTQTSAGNFDVKNGMATLPGDGNRKEALDILSEMQWQLDSNTYASLLQVCANTKSLVGGKQVHAHMLKNGVKQNMFLGTKLTSMYSKCGSVENARLVFDKMPDRDLFAWTAMIGGYVSQGHCEDALVLLHKMQCIGFKPDNFIFPSVLKACASLGALRQGKEIHNYIIRNGFESDVVVGNAIIDMYNKCGRVDHARQLFDKMSQRDVVSWNIMISSYVQKGWGHESRSLLRQMQLEGVKPNTISWNAMILGCIQNRCDYEALELFLQMQLLGGNPDSVSLASVVSACANLANLEQGKEIHSYIIRNGVELDVFMGSALVDMYAKCGSVDVARQIFDRMSERNDVLWNAMIAGYAQNGHGNQALELFWDMQLAGLKPDEVTWNGMIAGCTQSGHDDDALKLFRQMLLAKMKPDSFTFGSVVTACATLAALKEGKEIHSHIIKIGFELDVFVGSAIIDMYAKCSSMEYAHRVFEKMSQRNVVSWNAMIAGYGQNGQSDEGSKLFHQMEMAGLKPDMISWNALIAGYTQNGHGHEALKLLCQMQLGGFKPSSFTLVSVLPVCANLAALDQGKEIHAYIIRSGVESNVYVGSALVDMYAKCGSIQDAHKVFNKIFERNVVSWNVMILGYAMHGYGEVALGLFHQMQKAGLKPDDITFTGVLCACSHAGLMDEGWQYFHHMSQNYAVNPTMEHYACMVDLLGRAGHLEEAQKFIHKMPVEPDACVWGALLGACRIHCNIELGKSVAEHLFVIEPENAGNYVLLSNIYAALGMWDNVAKVRTMMKDRGLRKIPGCSWIQVKKRMYTFFVRDNLHPQNKEINAMLERLDGQMKKAGYVPDTNFALHDVQKEEKEYILCSHSERQALAFGLINTCPGTPIRIIKNLRMCGDCHSAAKFISEIVGREIFMRDTHRFHYFKDGLCSCRDYW